MTKQGLPAVSVLDSAGFDEFKGSDSVVLVGFFAADDKESNETYTKAASQLRDSYLFGASNDAELAEKEGVKQPAIVLYKTFDEGKNKFSKKFDVEAIEKFAKAAATPLIGDVGPETYQGYMSVGLHAVLITQLT
jgi:protein disulfide-isomerase A1